MSGICQNASLKRTIIFINIVVVFVVVAWFSIGLERFSFLPTSLVNRSQNVVEVYGIYYKNSESLHPKPNSNRVETKHSDSKSSTQACQFIKVNAFDPAIVKLAVKFRPINCSSGFPSFVYIDEPYLKINFSKIRRNPASQNFTNCSYRSVIRPPTSEFTVKYGAWGRRFNTSILLLDTDEHIHVECYDKKGIGISTAYFSRIVEKENEKQSILNRFNEHKKIFSPKETMNVLMVGIDGLSIQNFQRSMPKTNNFVINNLNGIGLNKFNKNGYITFANLLPLLTGHSYRFYTHKNTSDLKPTDSFDKINDYFMWSEFQNAGYRTALDLEEKWITAFHYLKKGWSKQPVDFYSRPSVIAMDGNGKMKTAGKFCKGDKPSITIHNDYLLELATRFNNSGIPYFALSFMTLLTHDDQNKASSGDDLYLSFLQRLKDQNLLHNTVLILFSDHGERFGSIRHTFNGMVESKTPACFIILPPWFKSKYPDEWNMLQVNADRLTSHYDLHTTLRNILYFKSSSKFPIKAPEIGISLFQGPIPESRTCQDAGIPIEFCNCNPLTKVKLDKKIEGSIASTVTDAIMRLLLNYQAQCQKLSPKSVLSVLETPVPVERIKSIFKPNSTLYHTTIATTPGHGVFEAVVEWTKKDKKARVIGSISRLDMYKGEKDCISNSAVRSLCLCK